MRRGFEAQAPGVLSLAYSLPVRDTIRLMWSASDHAKAYRLWQINLPDGPQVIYAGAEREYILPGQPIGSYVFSVDALGVWGVTGSNTVTVVVQPPPTLTPTPTLVPTRTPTITPTPFATMTPRPPVSSHLRCGATYDSWYLTIVDETGPFNGHYISYQFFDEVRGLVLYYDMTRTYTDTNRTYHINAEFWRVYDGGVQGRIWTDVTGGVFGNNTQYCQNY